MSEPHLQQPRVAKRAYIKTYGCQMNVYDSERMADALRSAGYDAVDSPDDADLLLLNTCHIREKAAEKVYSELGRLRKHVDAKRERGERMLVGVAGCVAQAEGAEIPRRQPLVDFVVGPQAYHRLPTIIAALECGAERQVVAEFPVEDKFEALPKRSAPRGPTAFVTVQEGCDKFCSFCVVPYTRGAESSRPVSAVCDEVRRLTAAGVVEVTLLGQNVNAYNGAGPDGERWGLAQLIRELADIDGLERIRYTTSHPRDMDDALIAAHAEVPQLMPYLHLPIQSGSDRVLRAMNRGHTVATYLRVIERVRAARPDLALSGDFIVGFPGETEADFADTLAVVDEVGYAQAFSFRYSARPGTPAATAPAPVSREIGADRLARLQARLERHGQQFQESCVGRELPVLFERPGRHPGQQVGRSPYLQPVHVDAPGTLRGQLLPVVIEAAKANSLAGRLAPVAGMH